MGNALDWGYYMRIKHPFSPIRIQGSLASSNNLGLSVEFREGNQISCPSFFDLKG